MEFLNKIVKFIKRSRITNLGPAKDWKLYQELFGTNQRRVSHETSLSIPAYFRALSILSEQIASLPFSIYETKADGNVVEAINHPLYSLLIGTILYTVICYPSSFWVHWSSASHVTHAFRSL